MDGYLNFSKVGFGAYSTVYQADEKEGGKVAVKVFHNGDYEVTKSAMREARFLAELGGHCNVVQLHEAYQSSSGRVYLVLEYAQHVLSKQIKSQKKGMPAVAVRSIIFQLLAALNHLHTRGVMHRDIKPANVLITSDGVVKLCDFGFARYAEGFEPIGEETTLTQYVTTRWYRPPEILAGLNYSTAVDIWAVGCIFAEMLTGQALFPGRSALDQLHLHHVGVGLSSAQQEVLRAKAAVSGEMVVKHMASDSVFERLAAVMTPSMMQFFRACLVADPEQRATAAQLLEMAFVKEGTWDAPSPQAPLSSGVSERSSHGETKQPPQQQQQHAQMHALGEHAGLEQQQHPSQQHQHNMQGTPSAMSSGAASSPAANSLVKSKSQRVVPTVKRRTARQAAVVLADSDEDHDDHPEVSARLRKLPPGEPLSDPEPEDTEDGAVPARVSAQQAVPLQLRTRQSLQCPVAAAAATTARGVHLDKALHTSFAATAGDHGKRLAAAAASRGSCQLKSTQSWVLSAAAAAAQPHPVSTEAGAEGGWHQRSNRVAHVPHRAAHDALLGAAMPAITEVSREDMQALADSFANNAESASEGSNTDAGTPCLLEERGTPLSALHRAVVMPRSTSAAALLQARSQRRGPQLQQASTPPLGVFTEPAADASWGSPRPCTGAAGSPAAQRTSRTSLPAGGNSRCSTPQQLATAAVTQAATAGVTARGVQAAWARYSCKSEGKLMSAAELECPPRSEYTPQPYNSMIGKLGKHSGEAATVQDSCSGAPTSKVQGTWAVSSKRSLDAGAGAWRASAGANLGVSLSAPQPDGMVPTGPQEAAGEPQVAALSMLLAPSKSQRSGGPLRPSLSSHRPPGMLQVAPRFSGMGSDFVPASEEPLPEARISQAF